MVLQRSSLVLVLAALVTFLRVLGVRGYVPAWPSNHTVEGIDGVRNTSILHLQWYTNGSDYNYVTRQPVGPETSSDPAQGILVHFTENLNVNNETTTTPWIAFVACDANSTDPSGEVDVLTMAGYCGAKSAILYSLYSKTCVIGPGYRNPVLEVFTTHSSIFRHIEDGFRQLGLSNASYFNAAILDAAAAVANTTFASGYPAAPGFLFATLSASNATSGVFSGAMQNNSNTTGTSSGPISTSSQDTGVAMIVLYVITGCVSALFCAVIVSGAIKAIRYPERYGPRSADSALGGGQSRAGGLGRAILDTFPTAKFRSPRNEPPSLSLRKDVELAPLEMNSSAPVPFPNTVRLGQLSPAVERDQHYRDSQEGVVRFETGQEARELHPVSEGTDQTGLPSKTNIEEHGGSRLPTTPCETDAPMPACIGRETCPICIVDFEEGDDLRLLPCEGKHQFHQSCVDPWLLELSASCPICRQDFRALETIISGESSEAVPDNRNSEASTPTTQNRFSRYLRYARRRQQRRDQESPPPEA